VPDSSPKLGPRRAPVRAGILTSTPARNPGFNGPSPQDKITAVPDDWSSAASTFLSRTRALSVVRQT
jgi:hypothetical protein